MKKLFAFASLLFLLSSCKSKTALNFSETIVKKVQSLEPVIKETENKVKDFIAAGNFDSMAVVSARMENLADEKMNEIKELKTPDLKYAGDFKSNAIEYFAFMKKVYTSYVNYARAGTEELRNKEYMDLTNFLPKKDEVIKNMSESQKKFAEANGFKLKS